MKFTISKTVFAESLQQVQNVVNSRASLPILSNVLMQLKDKKLYLTTTDLQVTIKTVIDVEQAEQEGEVTLPARKLFTIVAALPDEQCHFYLNEKNEAKITAGAAFFKILGLPTNDFPQQAQLNQEEAMSCKMLQGDLLTAFKSTAYAMSSDDTRYVLNGVYIAFNADDATFVATDGRRLAMLTQKFPADSGLEKELIIPSKAVQELQRVLRDNEQEVTIKLSSVAISFVLPNIQLTSKLIDGKYPNYQQVIPTSVKQRVALNRTQLLDTLKRISLLAESKTSAIKLEFADNVLTVSSNDREIGVAEEKIAIVYQGEPIAIAFNPEYFMAPIKNLAAEEVFLELIDSVNPGVLKIGDDFLYVLMPLSLN